eukprot:12027008-Ditylum_brightwellii.AAC.1
MKRLRDRLYAMQGEGSVKVIFVDNCCTVRQKWTQIFNGVRIKLDTYHWLARWNAVLAEPTSADAAAFRASMSRAIIVVGDTQFREKREELRNQLEHEPTVRQILNACSGVCPPPEIMEGRVRSTVRYFLARDADLATQHLVLQQGEDRPRLTLKSSAKVRALMDEQLKHVQNGCLSDEEGVSLHTQCRNGHVQSCCGSSGSESLNIELQNAMLKYQAVSLTRAERIFWYGICGSNERQNVRRRGAEDVVGACIESQALANSLCKDSGYAAIFKDVSMPACPPSGENLGFDFDDGQDIGGERNDSRLGEDIDDVNYSDMDLMPADDDEFDAVSGVTETVEAA